jgi:S-adenosylmethionine:tRNA ribosyltransferase-isomerase
MSDAPDEPRAAFDARALDYELPASAIAQHPLAERDAARLLCVDRPTGVLADRIVRELPELLAPSLIVVNDTRVIPARLFGNKASGGKVELLLVERSSPPGARERWIALAKGKNLRTGSELQFGPQLNGRVLERDARGYLVELAAEPTVAHALAALGQVPLPPYIERAAAAADVSRYQTVYAAHDGAVAAPTAGLHLTSELLDRLRAAGNELASVTLHVGPGTFAPLRSDDLRSHVMHEERYEIPEATADAIARARSQGRRVLAIGTTVVRALETAADEEGRIRPGAGRTAIFIYPPYRFRAVDALLTNFHLPRSTLLALVMAFAGEDLVRRAYRHAVGSGYRFYSYGDAMLIGGQS